MDAATAGGPRAASPPARRPRRTFRGPRRNACPRAPGGWRKRSVMDEFLERSSATSMRNIGFASLEKARSGSVVGLAGTFTRLVRVPPPRYVHLAKPLRRQLDCLDDLAVAGTATDVAGDCFYDILSRRTIVPFEKRVRRQDHPGRTKSALKPVGFAECILHDAELARRDRDPLDRRDGVPICLHREHQTGAHRLAVEQNRARTADA